MYTCLSSLFCNFHYSFAIFIIFYHHHAPSFLRGFQITFASPSFSLPTSLFFLLTPELKSSLLLKYHFNVASYTFHYNQAFSYLHLTFTSFHKHRKTLIYTSFISLPNKFTPSSYFLQSFYFHAKYKFIKNTCSHVPSFPFEMHHSSPLGPRQTGPPPPGHKTFTTLKI